MAEKKAAAEARAEVAARNAERTPEVNLETEAPPVPQEAVDQVNAEAVEGAQPVTTLNEAHALETITGQKPVRGGTEFDDEQQAALDAADAAAEQFPAQNPHDHQGASTVGTDTGTAGG